MNTDLLKTILEVVMSYNLLYLMPIVFLLMAITVAQKFLGLINFSIGGSVKRRYDS